MKALIVVDCQNDFCPGGSLAVKDGDNIILNINKLSESGIFDQVIATQDWHPRHHISFASSHWIQPFNMVGTEMVWPDHCIQGTKGAELRPSLNQKPINIIIRKGMDIKYDSYSGFADQNGKETGMKKLLDGVDEIYITGLATDYCVKATTLDALTAFYDKETKIFVVEDAIAGVDDKASNDTLKDFTSKGINIISTKEILGD